MTTKEVLHKFSSQPNSEPDVMIIGTGNIIHFVPTRPFKCTHILIWRPPQSTLIIKQIAIGNIHELAIPNIPGSIFDSPVSIRRIEDWFTKRVLSIMLREHHIVGITLSVMSPVKPLRIDIEGEFSIMFLYGVELCE
jgi:hypothetical protein